MRVEVRLFATFALHAPTGRSGAPFDLQLPEDASLIDLIRALDLPLNHVHLCIINGRIVHDRTVSLHESDRVGLFPPVGGG